MMDPSLNGHITVGIADFEVDQAPQVLETFSLGSCVGIAIYDPELKLGGLLHIMLPEAPAEKAASDPAKFADSGLQAMIRELESRGAKRARLVAKIAGGAAMFAVAVQDPSLAIGSRNIEAVKAQLKKHGIPIRAEDTGGNWGRTMEFALDTGNVTIKSALKGKKAI